MTARNKHFFSAKVASIFAICLTAFTASAAYAGGTTELVRARYMLVDKQHRLEENRDRVNARIQRMREQLDCLEKHSDWLNSELSNVKHAIVETDRAIASM